MKSIHKKLMVVLTSFLLFICFISFLAFNHHKNTDNWGEVLDSRETNTVSGSSETPTAPPPTEPSKETTEKEETPKTVTIMIDVKGAVVHPGVYTISNTSRVVDAIDIAGGLQKDADSAKLNLAEHLADEMVIYVPKKGEELPDEFSSGTVSPSASSPTANTTSSSSTTSTLVHLNSATEADIETIPGIGPAKAKAILDYREQNGPFKTIEDLGNVSGIGDKTIERLKPYLDLN
ncbi:helix-hairpin-helix domain-containing protein [Pullulanibacillus sp. KACC 23026]|uniref:helix-hairpin-helix domain-containing protein n=1 Tax=Pullulanibacillus sp. KACC 23026 TaxID=3028315 RepID=UPI0023AF240A|nr:helix-hairpin-helix domain-containing protein [Pullulanibacillus sp. KACC 23026]WEG14209.1 helix-hairpin-helix domain-containing protein [Pullulanibacillus sp. KACC 23026]